jgi:YgiT-type zinc finger domain-containing protein
MKDEKLDKYCNFCGNSKVKRARVDYIYRHNGDMLIVKGVPCEECEFCGERYFEADVLKRIENDFFMFYRNEKTIKNKVVIPIERFAEII